MKFDRPSTTGTAVTLQDVLDRLGEIDGLSEARRRDLRSAVRCYAKLLVIPLDLAAIRKNLDKMVPAQAKISAKRWANRRSDLAAAFAACGLMPMLKTARVRLEPAWASLLDQATDRAVQHGLSRFARWATLRRVAPAMVEASTIERFVSELEAASLARHVEGQYRGVATAWNALVAAVRGEGMRPIALPALSRAPVRLAWEQLPAAF